MKDPRNAQPAICPYDWESWLVRFVRWRRRERRVRSARSVQAEARWLFAQRHHQR